MIEADGRIDENEVLVLFTELQSFNVPKEHVEPLMAGADEMESWMAIDILSKLNKKQKKYVASFLGTIMVSDGDIDKKEMALWKLVSSLCNFPTMNVAEAVKNMAGY